MPGPGQRLRHARETLGYTIRDVETASQRIAQRKGNDEFYLNLSRISDIESKGVIPTIYRLYSLSIIYRVDLMELMEWYGVDREQNKQDMTLVHPPRTHRVNPLEHVPAVKMPVALDPQFDLRKTTNIGRMVAKWGVVPLVFLEQFADASFTYGYIGSDDLTMYPLLLPGSFIKVDETKDRVVEDAWRSEYERPIYFIESREGFTCSWVTLRSNQIYLQPHPLSPVAPRLMKYPQEAEVVGQVVGVAMMLDWDHSTVKAARSRQVLGPVD